MQMFGHVRKTGIARGLRQNSTFAKQRLWYRLRSRSLNGMKFVRQQPIGPYVVDSVCRECRLIVEVDGGQHCESARDAIRDRWLTDHGYRILRFSINDVLAKTEGALETVANAFQRDGRSPSPPSSGGEGRDEGGGPQGQTPLACSGIQTRGGGGTVETLTAIADIGTRGTPPSSHPSPPEEGGEGAGCGQE